MKWIKNKDFTEITCSECGFVLETNPLVAQAKSFGFPCTNCAEITELEKMVDKLLNLTRQVPTIYLEQKMTNMRSDLLQIGIAKLLNIVRLEKLGNDNSIKLEIEGEKNSFIRHIALEDMKKIRKYIQAQIRET